VELLKLRCNPITQACRLHEQHALLVISERGKKKPTSIFFFFFFLTCCLHSWRRQTTRTERAKITICSSTHCLLLFSIVFNPQLPPHLVIVLYWSLKHRAGHHVKGIWGGRSGAAEWRSRPQNHNLEHWWWWSARCHPCHHACRARKLLTGTDKKKKQNPLQKTSMSQVLACLLHLLHLQAFVWYILRMGPLQCSASSCLIASPSSSSRFCLVHDPEDGFIAMGAEIGWRRQKTGGLLWFGSRHKYRRSHHCNDHCTEQRKPQTPALVCSRSLRVLPKLFKHNLPTTPVWINKNSITDFHSNSHLHFLPICFLQYVSDPLADDDRLLVLCCWWFQILLLMIIDWFFAGYDLDPPDPFVDDDDWSDPLAADEHRSLCWQWWRFCCFQNL
jgi:hypothetical protein